MGMFGGASASEAAKPERERLAQENYIGELDADPLARGGPCFDNADDLIAYLADGVPVAAIALPRSDWVAGAGGDGYVTIATHTHGGAYWWTRVPLLDRLDALAAVDDLKDTVADPVHAPAV